jgi:hypothetical protein
MPSFYLNSSSDEYDADDGNTKVNIKGNKGARVSRKLPLSETKQIMEDGTPAKKRMPITGSRMTLRSSSKKGRTLRSRSTKNNDERDILRRPILRKKNRHQTQFAAPYPPRPVKTPPKCPVGAIQLPLPFHLFGGKPNSNELLATLINFREPRSNADSPFSPGILLSEIEHADSSKKPKQRPPTPFYSNRRLSDDDLNSPDKTPEALFTSRKKLFTGKTGSLEPSVEVPNPNMQGETQSPNITQLSDELSRVNFKSVEAKYTSPETKERYTATLDDGSITRKMEILLDLSYLKSGVQHADVTRNEHGQRIMLILDNPGRARMLIAMILRNNEGIHVEELMRHFDFFSKK